MNMEFSFKKGWNLLTAKQQPEVKKEIMKALGLVYAPSFYPRLNGTIEPRVSEARKIEKVFSKYGIKKNNVWGNE